MLKLVDAKDVLCFSYGVPGNWETEISRNVARKLGYPWEFVPYSRRQWRRWYRSREREAYALYAGQLVSIPHLQDWPAVGELKRRGSIAADALLVPGQTAPRELDYRPRCAGQEEIVRRILGRTYRYWNWSARGDELVPLFRRKVLDIIAGQSVESGIETVAAFESWGFQEMFPKFFINSVRAYEFWGFDWRLPIFGREMMDFYSQIPLAGRLDKSFFKSYLEERMFAPLDIGQLHAPENPRGLKAWSARLAGVYLAGFTIGDYLHSWRLHTQAFGRRSGSPYLLLSVNSLTTATMLRLWEKDAR